MKISNASREELIKAIKEQVETYPLLTVCDIYKTHFQDGFGPGHLIKDITQAREAIINETNSMNVSSYVTYEKTGAEGNYYRVNLQVVKDKRLSVNTLLMALVRSAESAHPPDNWPEIWYEIEDIVNEMHLGLPHYEKDIEEIHEILKGTDWAVHHSAEYNAAYDPHYRIINKEIFEKEILPIIDPTRDMKN